MFVHLSGMGVHCDHTVHVTAYLSLWLGDRCPVFWAPYHKSMFTYSQPIFFQFHLEERWDMDVQTWCDVLRMVEDRG